jgi:hypothetical protein
MQYTAVNGAMQGPALRERADGTTEVGVFHKNKRQGAWRTRRPDGTVTTTIYHAGIEAQMGKR